MRPTRLLILCGENPGLSSATSRSDLITGTIAVHELM
jgi:hypothetical protein